MERKNSISELKTR